MPSITSYIDAPVVEQRQTITEEEIDCMNVADLPALLEAAGIQILSYGPYGLEQKPSIRGFTDETVRVIINGVCVNNAQYGTFDFSTLNIKDIEKIGAVDKFVVSKGAQTATYELYKPTMDALEDYAKVFNSQVNPENGTMILKPYSSQSKKDKLNVITYENCIKCSFKGICRTTYCVGGKSIERK